MVFHGHIDSMEWIMGTRYKAHSENASRVAEIVFHMLKYFVEIVKFRSGYHLFVRKCLNAKDWATEDTEETEERGQSENGCN